MSKPQGLNPCTSNYTLVQVIPVVQNLLILLGSSDKYPYTQRAYDQVQDALPPEMRYRTVAKKKTCQSPSLETCWMLAQLSNIAFTMMFHVR